VEVDGGRLSLQRGSVTLSDVEMVLTLDGQDIPLSSMDPRQIESTPDSGERDRIRLVGTGSGVELNLTISVYWSYILVDANVHRVGEENGAAPVVAGLALRGVAAGPESPKGVLVNSYNGCSLADVTDLRKKGDDDEASFSLVGNGIDHERSDSRVSWWTGALAWAGSALVAGALSVDTWKTRVVTYDDHGNLSWNLLVGTTGDTLQVGGTANPTGFEELFITIEPAIDGLTRYGELVAQRMPPPKAPYVPVGWNPWNVFFHEISHDKIVATARALKEDSLGFPVNNIQIDGGWARLKGHWVADPELFPHGLEGIAQAIAAEGFIPGIWFSPFLVADGTPAAVEHDDWLLRDHDGQLLALSFPGEADLYLLDPSHPGAFQFMVDSQRQLFDAGFRYVKYDFGYAGCVEGDHYDKTVTAIMSCRKLLAELLDMADEFGAFLTTSNAPLLPNAGMVHAFRTGDDLAFEAFPYEFKFNRHSFRNVGIHFFFSPFLPPDPDTVMLRELSPNEQLVNATVNLMAGRIFTLGDDFLTLDDERREVLRRLAAIAPADRFTRPEPLTFRVLDLFDVVNEPTTHKFIRMLGMEKYDIASLWHQEVDANRDFLAVFNWNDEPASHDIAVSAVVGRTPKRVENLWAGESVPLTNNQVRVEVEPRSVVLLDIY
jgi:alpha-galactosidase